MNLDLLVETFFESLIEGNRPAARELIKQARASGVTPAELYEKVLWPTHLLLEKLHREDQMTAAGYQFATRLLRVVVDRVGGEFEQRSRLNKTIFACCGPSEGDELGAEMAVDLLEAGGFAVSFAGGGLPSDEVLAQVHELRPDILVLFASGPSDLPGIRAIVDQLREINACPNLQIAVGGGVFNRVEGLADEIGIQTWAETPMELVEVLLSPAPVRAARPVVAAAPSVTKKRLRPAA